MCFILKKAVIGFVSGTLSGFFGAGGGAALVILLQKVLKIDVHKAHATAIAIVLPISIASSFVYLRGIDDINWFMILYISIGGIAGGYVGAKYLNKLSGKTLHKIFGIFMIVAAIRMII